MCLYVCLVPKKILFIALKKNAELHFQFFFLIVGNESFHEDGVAYQVMKKAELDLQLILCPTFHHIPETEEATCKLLSILVYNELGLELVPDLLKCQRCFPNRAYCGLCCSHEQSSNTRNFLEIMTPKMVEFTHHPLYIHDAQLHV